MTKESIIFIQSKLYDAARLIGTFLEVQRGFFQHHQFLILTHAKHGSIYLPELEYKDLFTLNKLPTYHPDEYSNNELAFIQKQLLSFKYPKQILFEQTQKSYDDIKLEINKKLQFLFPTIYPNIVSVTIIVTPFGSDGSFDYKKVADKHRLFIWIRNAGCSIDQAVSHLIHCLISAYVLVATNIPDSLNNQWKNREAITDFLMMNTFNTSELKYLSTTLRVIESKQKPHYLVAE